MPTPHQQCYSADAAFPSGTPFIRVVEAGRPRSSCHGAVGWGRRIPTPTTPVGGPTHSRSNQAGARSLKHVGCEQMITCGRHGPSANSSNPTVPPASRADAVGHIVRNISFSRSVAICWSLLCVMTLRRLARGRRRVASAAAPLNSPRSASPGQRNAFSIVPAPARVRRPSHSSGSDQSSGYSIRIAKTPTGASGSSRGTNERWIA
jgi:hypothetical protein